MAYFFGGRKRDPSVENCQYSEVAEDFYDVSTFQPYGGLRDGAECGLACLHGGASGHVRALRHLHEAHDSWLMFKIWFAWLEPKLFDKLG